MYGASCARRSRIAACSLHQTESALRCTQVQTELITGYPCIATAGSCQAVVAIPFAISAGTYANAYVLRTSSDCPHLGQGKRTAACASHGRGRSSSRRRARRSSAGMLPLGVLGCLESTLQHRVSRHERFIIRVRVLDPHQGQRHALQEMSCADSCCQRQRDQPRRDGHSSVEHGGCTNFRRAGRQAHKSPMGCRRSGEYTMAAPRRCCDDWKPWDHLPH